MKRLATTPLLIALAILLGPATAQAGEALEELKGSWVAESFDGEAPPQGMKMVMTFVDDSILSMEMTFNGETQTEKIKYSATADGTITIFPEPDENADGDKAAWEVKDDKKLYIKTEDGEEMIFARPA